MKKLGITYFFAATPSFIFPFSNVQRGDRSPLASSNGRAVAEWKILVLLIFAAPFRATQFSHCNKVVNLLPQRALLWQEKNQKNR